MARNQAAAGRRRPRVRTTAPHVTVIAFFCVPKILDDISGTVGLAERADFALNLFGA